MKKRFPDGVPLLDPIEDMGIKEKGLKEVIRVRQHLGIHQLEIIE